LLGSASLQGLPSLPPGANAQCPTSLRKSTEPPCPAGPKARLSEMGGGLNLIYQLLRSTFTMLSSTADAVQPLIPDTVPGHPAPRAAGGLGWPGPSAGPAPGPSPRHAAGRCAASAPHHSWAARLYKLRKEVTQG